MQVSLCRALKSANIADDPAEKVVHAFEEHIDMALSEAMKHYDNRITATQSVLEAKIDAGFKGFEGPFTGIEGQLSGMRTSIDVLKWMAIIQGTLIVCAGTLAGFLKVLS